MKEYLKVGAVGAVSLFIGGFLALHFGLGSVQTGGDFAGGVVPNQLWLASAATQSVTPIPGTPNIITSGNLVTTAAALVNDLIVADQGFSLSFIASSTITAQQFCSATSIHVANTGAAVTLTLPAATSSYATCGSPLAGAYSQQLIINDSTNTVTIAAGAGVTLMNETIGPGTTTVQGTINTIPASSSQIVTGIWLSSSSLYVMTGNTFH